MAVLFISLVKMAAIAADDSAGAQMMRCVWVSISMLMLFSLRTYRRIDPG
jgi:hypothetical protein